MIKIIIAVALAAVGIIWLKRLSEKSENENRNEIDNWADETVAKALEKKLNVPLKTVLQLFQGSQDTDLLAKIQSIIDSVTLNFTKLSPSSISLRLEINYKDGTSYSVTIEKDWDRLPDKVREEFLRKGSKTVSLLWNMPLKNTKTKEDI